jgi:hypothetical protein
VELNMDSSVRTLHFWKEFEQIPYSITLPNSTNFYFAFSVDSGHETQFISLKQLPRAKAVLKPEIK